VVDTQLSPTSCAEDPRLPRVHRAGGDEIFGGSGDLTARKLIPALYDLVARRRLPMESPSSASRAQNSHEEFEQGCARNWKSNAPAGVSDEVWNPSPAASSTSPAIPTRRRRTESSRAS
jgi:hypothetical protein